MIYRRNRLRRASLVLALLVLATIVTGVAESATTTPVPKQLTGKWGLQDQVVMVVGPQGKVNISKAAPWNKPGWYHTKFSRVTAHEHHGRLSISGPRSCPGTGGYSWKISHEHEGFRHGYQLAFTKIHDACKLRINLVIGADNWGRNTRW